MLIEVSGGDFLGGGFVVRTAVLGDFFCDNVVLQSTQSVDIGVVD